MRLFAYTALILVYLLALVVGKYEPSIGTNLTYIWAGFFVLVAAEIALRLRFSRYLFFPLGYVLIILSRFFDLPDPVYDEALGGLFHGILGGFLINEFLKVDRDDKEIRTFFLVAAVASFAFATQVLLLFDLPPLSKILDLRISSYVLVALIGRYLILDRLTYDYPEARTALSLVVLVHVFMILGEVLGKFL